MNNIVFTDLDVLRIIKSIEKARQNKSICNEEAESLLIKIIQAEVVKPIDIPSDIVTMNSVVEFKFIITCKTEIVQIVYPYKENKKENKISIFSSLSTALIGNRVKDIIEWNKQSTRTELLIERILYQPEASDDFPL
jgi:regulator of nucleoside diphosphate kinase